MDAAAPRLPDPRDVVALQEVREYPAVSVLLNTTPGPVLDGRDVGRLAQLLEDAEARLGEEMSRDRYRELLERLRQAALAAAEAPAESALALFASSSAGGAFHLAVPVQERVVVDPTFATRDLVRSLHRRPRTLVLAVGPAIARLVERAAGTPVEVRRCGFPVRLQRGRAPVVTSPPADRVRRWCRDIARQLDRMLAREPGVVVVVAHPRVADAVTGALAESPALTDSRALAGVVARSPVGLTAAQLVELARPTVDDHLRWREAASLSHALRRLDESRAVEGVRAAWLAARAGRPEMLAVEEGFFLPARLDPDGDLLLPADDVTHPEVVDDVVDELIEAVLARGGWVTAVQDGTLATHDRVVLTLRD